MGKYFYRCTKKKNSKFGGMENFCFESPFIFIGIITFLLLFSLPFFLKKILFACVHMMNYYSQTIDNLKI